MPKALPALDPPAEAALLARARRAGGTSAVAAELFRALREPVLALCLHLTGDRADAEDALQEVFLSVHRSLPLFRGEARLTTWVYRIALNAALRSRARRRPAAQVDPETPGGGGEEHLAARDEARRVAAAVARLPAEHRAVLSLFALDGLPHREVAEILGIPEGTVWSRLHAARRRLQADLAAPPAAAGPPGR